MKKLILLIVAIGLLFPIGAQDLKSVQEPLIVFLVRHAEKVDSSRDPELSEAGKERALELASSLASAELEHIYSTDFIRTRETVRTTAKQFDLELELYNPSDLAAFAQKLKSAGGRHLVVGHSNTTPQLAELLGGDPYGAIDEKGEYNRLYVIAFDGDEGVNTLLLRYGMADSNKQLMDTITIFITN